MVKSGEEWYPEEAIVNLLLPYFEMNQVHNRFINTYLKILRM